jgi:hypothetical protein
MSRFLAGEASELNYCYSVSGDFAPETIPAPTREIIATKAAKSKKAEEGRIF